MDLTTIERVKVQIEKVQATDDRALGMLITATSAQVEKHLNRLALKTARTVYRDATGYPEVISLEGYGDSASAITSVYHDVDRLYGSDTLLETTDYTFDPETGLLYTDDAYPEGRRAWKITYTGGMATTTALFIAAYPDVAGAVDRWVVQKWQTRGNVGQSNVSFEGGSMSLQADEMPKEIAAALRPHRRMSYVR